jgi:hypothetical protein
MANGFRRIPCGVPYPNAKLGRCMARLYRAVFYVMADFNGAVPHAVANRNCALLDLIDGTAVLGRFRRTGQRCHAQQSPCKNSPPAFSATESAEERNRCSDETLHGDQLLRSAFFRFGQFSRWHSPYMMRLCSTRR